MNLEAGVGRHSVKSCGVLRICLFSFGLFLATSPSFAQNGVDPSPPYNPQSMEECGRLSRQWQQRINELLKQNQDCSSAIFDRCGKAGQGEKENACLQREHCQNCNPERSSCGNVYYQFTVCRGAAMALQCAGTHAQDAAQKCEAEVNKKRR